MIPEAHLVCPHGLGPNYCDRCAVLVLTAQLAEARAVLREVQWSGNPDHTCPMCEGMPDDEYGSRVLGIPHGHAPDCRLARVL